MAIRTVRRFPGPPEESEFELSIFGPGVGECILLHLGYNRWLVVDSCIDRSGRHPAIAYLEEIGLDPSRAVKWICATHFHDDHVRGLGMLVEACSSAQFYCSAAASRDEFRTMLGSEVVATGHSAARAMRELRRVVEVLEARASGRPRVPGIKKLISNRVVVREAGDVPIEVMALAPSDTTVGMADMHLVQLMPTPGESVRPIAARELNALSVVLWIRCGGTRVLLGGDLETTGHGDTGWNGVLALGRVDTEKAGIFKVPHHGSENGTMTECGAIFSTVAQ